MSRRYLRIPLAMMLIISMLLGAGNFGRGSAEIQGSGFAVYGESGQNTPRYREWRPANTAWTSEASLPTAGAANRYIITKGSTTRNEIIAGVVNTSGLLTIYRWDGFAWTSEWTATVPLNNTPAFDIAYEQNSGQAVVFLSRNVATTNELGYNVWDGTSWSGITSYDAVRTSGTIHYVKAATLAGSSDLAVAWGDSNLDLSANYWNGTTNAFVAEPAAALSTGLGVVGAGAVITNRVFDLAFEQTSGELIVVWGNGTTRDLIHRTRAAGSGGAWAGANTTTVAFLEEPTDLQLASEPGTNYIAYANASDNGADADRAIWNGTTWTVIGNVDTSIDTVSAGTTNIAVEWLVNGAQSRAVITYDDNNAAGIDWYVYNKNTNTWAAQTDYNTAPSPNGTNDHLHSLTRNPFNNSQLYGFFVDNGSDIFSKELDFDGTNLTWTNREPSSAVMENNVTSLGGWIAGFDYSNYAAAASLGVDIVNASNASVASPSINMTSLFSSVDCQTSTGAFGTASEKIRVSNTTTNEKWTLSIAATGGATTNWSSGANSYDFNDSGGSGCTDSGDVDSLAGQLSIDPSTSTITPKFGCVNTNVTSGSSSAFNQGVVDSITLLTASAGAYYDCYWDMTAVNVSQDVPANTPQGNYNLPLTLTTVAN